MRRRQAKIALLALLAGAWAFAGQAQDESTVRANPGQTIKAEAQGIGAATAKVVGCDDPTKTDYPKEPGQLVSGLNWRFNVFISDTDGLVVRDIFLGPRQMANDFRLPYYQVPVTFVGVLRCELKPDSKDQTCRSRLVDFAVETDNPESIVARATYAVDKFPRHEKRCLLIKQVYEFSKEHQGVPHHCEPFGTARCARFRPIVSYKVVDKDLEVPFVEIRTFQRLHFLVDGRAVNHAAIGIDQEPQLTEVPPAPSPVKWRGGNPLSEETSATAVVEGKAASHSGLLTVLDSVDHFHQSALKRIDPPGFTHFGCPECVHMHLRWSSLVTSGLIKFSGKYTGFGPQHGDYPQFGGGKPLIPPGSKQSVFLLITSDLEKEPRDAWDLIKDHSSLEKASPVLWYVATSTARSDEFFGHGGFFNSYGLNLLDRRRGGTVARTSAQAAALSTIDGGPKSSARMQAGTDIIYHFLDKQTATFDFFCVTVDPLTASDNLRRFELFTSDTVEGPWTKLGEYQASQTPPVGASKRSGLDTDCDEFTTPPTTTRFLKLHVATSWSSSDSSSDRRAVVGHIRLYGLLNEE